ncbi:MAG: prepilin-type N-terminal cleavage/methylation domain-containing protein [Polaromonas sp.]
MAPGAPLPRRDNPRPKGPAQRTRAAPTPQDRCSGFTLIELLIVVAIMAIATAGVGLALRDTSGTALEREAQRLAVLLESARAQSRMTGSPVQWRPTASGFLFEGIPPGSAFPSSWLGQDVQAATAGVVVLGPEPVIGPQQIRLVSTSEPSRSLTLATDGVRPFSVLAIGAAAPGTP